MSVRSDASVGNNDNAPTKYRWRPRNSSGHYSSNHTGLPIVNAVTGLVCAYNVGSRGEQIYFKVVDSTTRNGDNCSNTFYYDSPSQYVKSRFKRCQLRDTKESAVAKAIDKLNAMNSLVVWTPSSAGKGKMFAVPDVNPDFVDWWNKKMNHLFMTTELNG